MQYLITFLEGIISFISPCMLPLLPLYISYFAGASGDDETGRKKQNVLPGAIAFVLGFTAVFSAMGVFAGAFGSFLGQHQTAVNIVCGVIVIIFGLSYLEVINLPFFKGISRQVQVKSVFSAFLFGMIYSISLTPCVGAFLGSALMMASAAGTMMKGLMLLITYSAGLGIPFVISAVLIEQLEGSFDFIKKHYGIINKICGIFLIAVGVMMIFGMMNRVMAIFS